MFYIKYLQDLKILIKAHRRTAHDTPIRVREEITPLLYL